MMILVTQQGESQHSSTFGATESRDLSLPRGKEQQERRSQQWETLHCFVEKKLKKEHFRCNKTPLVLL